MIEALDCRFVAEPAIDTLTLTAEVNTGEHNCGWVPTDTWTMEYSLGATPTDQEFADHLEQHGWRLTGEIIHTGHTTSGAIQPSDWLAVVERATASLQQAERIYLARNGLIAAAPREAVSAIKLGEAAGIGRHRIYQLQGFGTKEPGFHF